MTDDSSIVDSIVRLSTTSRAVEALRRLQDAEEPLDEVLTRVAETAVKAILDADAVTITVLPKDGDAHTAAFTDEQMVEVDTRQYESGRGPCLEAARRRMPVRVVVDVEEDRWPEFVAAAKAHGVRATLSAPLLVGDVGADREMVGSLNVYSRTTSAFDSFDEELVRLFTVAASMAITNAQRWQQTRDTVSQLERALSSRSIIDQAKGVLRLLYDLDADEAFAMLVKQSQDRNVKLYTVAEDILEALRRKDSETGAAQRVDTAMTDP
ncbi:GAF and ANTAR domain-containing protein [Mycobacterium yunnanensis]|uniref:GAF and ANTAR domain-containing protein n=1 Tax=Mycobacterium yunnanensis TaxID=368477 RepID=A0A9X2Z7L1_9MYCO|nr:GAF and ANTAR domain-containing protein [Mycobacterium yunnanensis]MCV7423476.1 GAF and ANTAR domain-containing protein [Mycobacterium yunnanensis]